MYDIKLASPSTKGHYHDPASYITEVLMIKRDRKLINFSSFWRDRELSKEFLKIRSYVEQLLKEFPPFLVIDLITYSKITDCNFDAIKNYLNKKVSEWVDKRNKHVAAFCKKVEQAESTKPVVQINSAKEKQQQFAWI